MHCQKPQGSKRKGLRFCCDEEPRDGFTSLPSSRLSPVRQRARWCLQLSSSSHAPTDGSSWAQYAAQLIGPAPGFSLKACDDVRSIRKIVPMISVWSLYCCPEGQGSNIPLFGHFHGAWLASHRPEWGKTAVAFWFSAQSRLQTGDGSEKEKALWIIFSI